MLKKYLLSLLILLLFATGCMNTEIIPEEYAATNDPVQSMKTLLNSIPAIREIGSDEDMETMGILVDLLEEYGYDVYLQELDFLLFNNGIAFAPAQVLPHQELEAGGMTHNIIAESPFYDAGKKTVIICAHHDTSRFPGANDNGSGVAVLMELAKTVSEMERYNLRYILFAGEENMMFGSAAYRDGLTEEERDNIAAVINLDTLSGSVDPEITFATGEYTEAYYLFEEIFKDNIAVNLNPEYPSGDESMFASCQIPSLSIGQPGYEVIHSPDDTVENLDFEDLLLVYELLYRALTSSSIGG